MEHTSGPFANMMRWIERAESIRRDGDTAVPRVHPVLDNPGLRNVIRSLAAAGTQDEWNEWVAVLVACLSIQASPSQSMDTHGAAFNRALEGALMSGFRPEPHRPRATLRARYDAGMICGNGITTFADAVWWIMSAERSHDAGLSDDERKKAEDVARKRVRAAEREGGFHLVRAKPYGRGKKP